MADSTIMELVQEYASAWSLVGGRFDEGTQLECAQQIKEQLRARIEQLQQENQRLSAENAGLREDKALLDWLDERLVCHIAMDDYEDGTIDVAGGTVRTAVKKRRDEIAARGAK